MSWIVVHLRPRTEKKMALNCALAHIPHYLPLRKETKIYQRRRVTVEKPIFPGYLFVDCLNESRQSVVQSPYTVRILEPPDEAALLNEIEQIRRALEVDPELDVCSPLKRGRRVRITGGPFMGIEGEVDQIRGQNQVRLNVNMIGQAVAVLVPREYVTVADF